MSEQLPLYGFHDMKPRAKVPISAARIEEAKREFEKGNQRGSIEIMREIREKLENYCNRIRNAE